jgi:hypothetical protein
MDEISRRLSHRKSAGFDTPPGLKPLWLAAGYSPFLSRKRRTILQLYDALAYEPALQPLHTCCKTA